MAAIRAELPAKPFPPTAAAAPLVGALLAPDLVTVLTTNPYPGSGAQTYEVRNPPCRDREGRSRPDAKPNPWQDMRAVPGPQSGSKKQAACQPRAVANFIVFPESFVDSVSLTWSRHPEIRLLAEHRVLQNEAFFANHGGKHRGKQRSGWVAATWP
jgi:hypothetical protein